VQAPLFNPVVGPFYQGLAVTVPLPLRHLPGRPSLATVHAELAEAYAGERFVRVMALGDEGNLVNGFFDVQGCNGTNRADIFVFGHEEQAVVIVRLDNLGKGASGSAVQCMNLRFGCDEAAGLQM
jgi:N-acetyl-gamma-glutamyl-phosphate reductase